MKSVMPKLPKEELLDELVLTDGIIYGFTAMKEGSMMPTDNLLNVFDRRTSLKIILNVIDIMVKYYEKNKDANWVIFGGDNLEQNKMKLYDKLAKELINKYNVNKKIITNPNSNETYFLLFKGKNEI